jgi:hypothetical protein
MDLSLDKPQTNTTIDFEAPSIEPENPAQFSGEENSGLGEVCMVQPIVYAQRQALMLDLTAHFQ